MEGLELEQKHAIKPAKPGDSANKKWLKVLHLLAFWHFAIERLHSIGVISSGIFFVERLQYIDMEI